MANTFIYTNKIVFKQQPKNEYIDNLI